MYSFSENKNDYTSIGPSFEELSESEMQAIDAAVSPTISVVTIFLGKAAVSAVVATGAVTIGRVLIPSAK